MEKFAGYGLTNLTPRLYALGFLPNAGFLKNINPAANLWLHFVPADMQKYGNVILLKECRSNEVVL